MQAKLNNRVIPTATNVYATIFVPTKSFVTSIISLKCPAISGFMCKR